MPDPAELLLRRSWAGGTDDTRAAAWDAFHNSSSPDDLAASLQKLSLPDDLKADLWDLKSGVPATSLRPKKLPSAEDFMTPDQIRNADSNRSWPATIGEALLGALKGGGSTAVGIARMAADAGMVPGMRGGLLDMPNPMFDRADEALAAKNMPQRVGKLGEIATEFALPAAKLATAVPALLREAPAVASKLAPVVRRIGSEGVVGTARKTVANLLGDVLERAGKPAQAAVADVGESAPVRMRFGQAERMRFGAEPTPVPEPVPVVAEPVPAVEPSPNAGGTLVREKAPTLTEALTEELAKGEPTPPPARVTLPPPAELPAGYTPRTTAPKPKPSGAARAAAQAEASARESATMGPRNYFLRKPAAAAADVAAEPAAAGPIDVADLPVSWRSRTGPIPTKQPITAKDAEEVAAELTARGLSPKDAMLHIAQDKSLTAAESNYLMNALKKAARRKAS